MVLTRKRLWKFAGGAVLFLFTLAVGNAFLPRERSVHRDMLGHDFLVFYSGGLLARTGQFGQLYHMDVLRRMEHDIGVRFGLELGVGFGPWWNPPHAAWLFAPFSYFDYPTALLLWQLASAGMFIASVAMLIGMLPVECDWKTRALVPLLAMVFMPFLQAVSHGQNTFLTLVLLTATVALWRAKRAYMAGLICGLLAYKPQHAAVVGLVLTLSLGWRAAAGLATTGAITLGVTLFTMPGALHEFLFTMPANLKVFQEGNAYMWERHMTFKGFWRLLLQGRGPGETTPAVLVLWVASWLALAVPFARSLWACLRRSAGGARYSRDAIIAATIVATPLFMPFYFDYDLLLLVIPATLYAAERMRRGPREGDRALDLAWAALFLCTAFSNLVAGKTRVSFSVIPLTAVAFLMIRRMAPRREVLAQSEDFTTSVAQPAKLAA